jgi:hypothetical protein
MSIARTATRIGYFGATCALLSLAACDVGETSIRLPDGYRLVQKREFQALYGPTGKIDRLLQDRDQDGRADAVILYYSNGKPRLGELDTDGDGRVDRWEHFFTDGKLEKVDLDTNGDGRVDRTDYAQ